MSDVLGNDARGLRCTDTSGHLVSHSWQYGDGKGGWFDDVTMSLVAADNLTNCGSVTITLSGDVSQKFGAVAGKYLPLDMFSAGRHVYKHTNGNYYLHIWPGKVNWFVSSEIGGGSEYIFSPAAGSLNPADQKNTYSNRMGWKSWRYKSGSGLEEAGADIRVHST